MPLTLVSHAIALALNWVLDTRISDYTHAAKSCLFLFPLRWGGSVAEWLACWTQAQKGLGSNRSRDDVR